MTPLTRALGPAAALLAAGGILAVIPPAVSSAAAAATLCRSQTRSVAGGAYTIQNNEWGSSAPECISTAGGARFTVASSAIANPASGAPGGYPSIYAGCHWGACTAGRGLPVQVRHLRPGTVTTSWATAQPGGSSDYDVAYDIWFNQAPATSGQPDGTELMIWLNHHGPVQPFGSPVATNLTLGHHRYDVWFGKQAWNTVSYTMTRATTSVSRLDLHALIADAVRRGYLSPSWYLIDVEAGFELWQGGTGLATRSFSVNVAGGGTPSPSPTPAISRARTPSPSSSLSAVPAFSISSPAISPDPTTPGTATNATVDFKNTGPALASGLTLVTKVVNSAGTVVGSQSWKGQSVAPQQTLNETCTWTAAAPAGRYTVEGRVQDSHGKTLRHAQVATITVK